MAAPANGMYLAHPHAALVAASSVGAFEVGLHDQSGAGHVLMPALSISRSSVGTTAVSSSWNLVFRAALPVCAFPYRVSRARKPGRRKLACILKLRPCAGLHENPLMIF